MPATITMATHEYNKVLLSTGNIMEAGAEVIRRPTLEKSNTELVNSLKESFTAASLPQQVGHYTQAQNGEYGRSAINGTTSYSPKDWTCIKDSVLHVPDMTGPSEELSEDRDEYDITGMCHPNI